MITGLTSVFVFLPVLVHVITNVAGSELGGCMTTPGSIICSLYLYIRTLLCVGVGQLPATPSSLPVAVLVCVA